MRSPMPSFELSALPFGDTAVDAHLPGGLALGHLHEIGTEGLEVETGAITAAFAAGVLGLLPDPRAILWIAAACDLYAPGLAEYGLDPGRLVLVRTGRDTETLQAMETALREGAAAAVLGEVGRLDRLPTRRLQLACLKCGTTGLVLRRWPHGRKRAATQDGNAAATRWHLRPEPSAADHREPGRPRWRVDLLHARGGRPGAWIMEQADAPHPLRVVATLANDPPARSAVGQ
jgi:protein ImuA